MGDQAPIVNAGTVAWLLDGDDPSVRYFTLTGLLGQAAGGAEAEAARREIMTTGAVPDILAAQGEDGHFGERDRFYTAKYTGTVWQLIILAELGADGADERVRRACEAILRDAQDGESGGFSVSRSKKAGGGLHSWVIPCLTGNLVFSLIRLGYLDEPRVRRAVDWITTYQRFDDADGDAPTGWPYEPGEMCWGRHTCHMGAVKALKALAEIPPERRSPEVRRTLADGVGVSAQAPRPQAQPRSEARLQARLAALRLPAHVPDRRARDPGDPDRAGRARRAHGRGARAGRREAGR